MRVRSRDRGRNGNRLRWGASYGILILVVVVLGADAAYASHLSPQEKRGRQLYMKTTSPSGGEVKAFLGKESFEAPGSAVACVNCHGYDGYGIDEAGVAASNITWDELTKPYGVKRIKGREHPAYTEESLVRAIREGVDPAGNRLDPVMPRYTMSEEDFNDLIHYIRRLGSILDPGLTDRGVVLGTLIPRKGGMAEIARGMEGVMSAYVAEINKRGGVFSRAMELRVAEYDGTPESAVAAAKYLIDEEEVFALVSPVTSGADAEIVALAETEEVPLIAPFTFFPDDVSALNRFTFYLFSGLREQARVLGIYAREKLPGDGHRVALVSPNQGMPRDVVDAAVEQVGKGGWASVERASYSTGQFDAAATVKELKGKGVEAVLFLGGWGELKRFAAQAERENWTPYLFLYGSGVGRDLFDLPTGFGNRIYLSYPHLPTDQTESGQYDFGTLLSRYNLPKGHLAAQVSAYCAVKVFMEGMKLTGKQLNRVKLITALERLYEFPTGLTRAVTYGPNHRIGIMGAHILSVDLERKAFVPTGRWISLD